QPGKSAAATPPATRRAPSRVSRAAVSRNVWTTRAVLQLPRMIVTHSRADAASASPSTRTGSQRARLAASVRATRSTAAPARCSSAIVRPRSSMPSKLTMVVSASRCARSRTRARAPSGDGWGLALRVVVRLQQRGHAGRGTGTDGDQVDARKRDPAEPVQQGPTGEAVLHDDEPAGDELALQHCAHLLGGERAGEPGNGQLRQEAPIIGHAATSLATRSRSAAATGASGARTGPPYRPPPTASIAAFTPAGPSLATISLSSGTRRS